MSEELSREQAIEIIKIAVDITKRTHPVALTNEEFEEARDMVIAALSAEQDYKDFAEYVAMLIFEYAIEMDMETFSELACRKLAKLGIVRANGDKWERVK